MPCTKKNGKGMMRVRGLTGRIVYGLLLAYVVPAMPLPVAMPRSRWVALRGFGVF